MNDATRTAHLTNVKTRNGWPGLALNMAQTSLKVKDVMNEDVITASPSETIFSVTKRMCSSSVSCVVIVDAGAVVGIFTERDLLRRIARDEADFYSLPVGEHMSSPTVVASPEVPVVEAGRIIRSHKIKHLPVVAEQRLVGIVTQTDITQGLICLTPLQHVSEVMSSDIATVGLDTTVADAARIMSSRNISCVVVMQWSQAVGILTQKDILRRVIAFHKDPTLTEVSDAMSVPVLPIPSHYSVFTANRTMNAMHIHRLVVLDEGGVHGIVSQTDVMNAVAAKLAEEDAQRRSEVCSEIPLFTLDATGVIIYANAAFLRCFDLETCDAVVGKPLPAEDFWSGPRDRERVAVVLRQGEAELLGLAARTAAGRRKRVVLLVTAMKSNGGVITGWQGVVWDGTRHKPRKKAFRQDLQTGAQANIMANP